MRLKNRLGLLTAIIGLVVLGGCRPYDVPEFVEIAPSESAIAVPLDQDGKEQVKFDTEEAMRKLVVPMARYQIPHRWVQKGRTPGDGEWIDTVRILKVDRVAVSRSWTNTEDTGTNNGKDEAIRAESKESIAFTQGFNCTAYIANTDDAVRFLVNYSNRELSSVMDREVHDRVASNYAKACAMYTFNDNSLMTNKGRILETVQADVIPYFRSKGITISVLGYDGGIDFTNETIRDAVNKKFAAAKAKEAQLDINAALLSEAEAKAKAARMAEASKGTQIQLMRLQNEAERIKKWDGKLPMVTGGGTITDLGKLSQTKDEG